MSRTAKTKIMPNLDQEGTKLLNLTVLQRTDSSIEEILMTVSHVALYDFDISLPEWNRKKVEGSLFVVKRNTQPRFQFIVMNRLSTENYVEDLLEDFEYEIQNPYLIFRVAKEVTGIWFYNASECEHVGNLFSRILSEYPKKVPAQIKESTRKSEFEELDAVSTTGITEGPYFAPSSSTAAEDNSVLNFFPRTANTGPTSSSQAHHTTIPLSFLLPNYSETPASVHLSISAPSFTITSFQESSEISCNNRVTTNLVMPSFFLPAVATQTPARISVTGTPSARNLQPTFSCENSLSRWFPTPAPHISYTPNHASLTREKVRDALHILLQDYHFVEMFYQALTKDNQ